MYLLRIFPHGGIARARSAMENTGSCGMLSRDEVVTSFGQFVMAL